MATEKPRISHPPGLAKKAIHNGPRVTPACWMMCCVTMQSC